MTIGAFSSPRAHHLVEAQPEPVALAVAEPADPRRQTLERDPLAGQARSSGATARRRGTPRARPGRWRRCRPDRRTARPSGTGPCPRRTAAGCRPAGTRDSRTPARTRRAGPRRAGCCRSRTPRLPRSRKPTIARQCSAMLSRARRISSCGSVRGHLGRRLGREVGGHVAERIVGAGLVGDDVGREVDVEQLRHDARRRCRPARPTARRRSSRGRDAAGDRVVDASRRSRRGSGSRRRRSHARRVDVDAQRHAAVHRDRQRLRAAHPAEPGGERDRAGQRAAEPAPGDLGEALVGALQDPLRADVDPRAGGHLPVHRQAHRLEPAELVPVAPLGHEVASWRAAPAAPTRGCGTRRPACRDWTSIVSSSRSVVQRARHGVERVPAARGPPGAAVDDEIVGPLGDLGIEVVVQHPVARPPAASRGSVSVGAARRADRTGSGHRHRIDLQWRRWRLRRRSRTAAVGERASRRARRSGDSQRSGPGPATDAAERGERGAGRRRRLQRRAEVERRRRADELDGQDPAQVGDARGAACAPPPSPLTRGPPASRSSAATASTLAARPGAGSPIAIAACV